MHDINAHPRSTDGVGGHTDRHSEAVQDWRATHDSCRSAGGNQGGIRRDDINGVVPLDYIAAELHNHPSADLDYKVRTLCQRLYNIRPECSEQELDWHSSTEGMDALASASPDGDVLR